MSIVKNFSGFLTHHSGELRVIASVLETVVGSLPLDRGDKDRISGVLNTLQNAATNIANSANNMKEPPKVVIKKSDIEEAVRSQLTDVLKEILDERENAEKGKAEKTDADA